MSRLLVESRPTRRVVGQLSQGEDLLTGLLSICNDLKIRCAEIRAAGTLEDLSVVHYERPNRTMGPARQFRGPLQLLQTSGILSELDGKLDLQLSVVASRQRDNGVELLGGQCAGAKVISCEFVLEIMDDLILRRDLDRKSGLNVWKEYFSSQGKPSDVQGEPASFTGQPAAPEAAVVETKHKWADAVMESVRAHAEKEEETEQEDEPYRSIREGDIIEHRQFGRCEVQRVDANEEFVSVRLRNSRLVRLNLDILNLRYTGEEEEHQIFSTDPKDGDE